MKIQNRRCGILMPISCLKSKYGIGSLGKEARRFVDFLRETKHTLWQVLPINQTGFGDSPYSSSGAFSLNPYFIDIDVLREKGYLTAEEAKSAEYDGERVNYAWLYRTRYPLLKKAYARAKDNADFLRFVARGDYHGYSLFMAIKDKFGGRAWNEWEENYKKRNLETLAEFEKEHQDEIGFWQFTQFEFLEEWRSLRAYTKAQGVEMIGDIPMYVAYDSADVWENPEFFCLDKNLNPKLVAGVPPDSFTSDGQLWGNPIYDWEAMRKDGYSWWIKRMKKMNSEFDITRIDHFRGFSDYYAIRYGAKNAVDGVWKRGYGRSLFKRLKEEIPTLQIIAENLGYIDDRARRMFRTLDYPGMKILLFAFNGDSDANEHLPSLYGENYYVYTGTHDNETLVGFLQTRSGDLFLRTAEECRKISVEPPEEDTTKSLYKAFIRLLYGCKADTAILPIWDLLALGNEARMNTPSTLSVKNWSVKLNDEEYLEKKEMLLSLAEKYDRING